MDEQSFRGFAPPTSNFSPLPHQLIEAFPLFETKAEVLLVLYILRHTWGFHDDGKRITVDEFMHGRKRKDGTRIDAGVGMGKAAVIEGLRRAEAHGFIVVEVDDSDKARVEKRYGLCIDEGYDFRTPVVRKSHPGGTKSIQRSEKETSERNPRKISLPRASRGEFTASKFYLVADEKRIIFIKPYKQADAQAECNRLKDYGVIAIKGSDLNADADRYAEYERRKPQRQRDATFDAFGEGAFNLPSNFDTSNIGKDGGRIGKLVSQLASHLNRTFNDIVNDSEVATRVKAYYRWRKTDERYKHLSARDPLVFLGEWKDFEEWEALQSKSKPQSAANTQPTPEQQAAAKKRVELMRERLAATLAQDNPT